MARKILTFALTGGWDVVSPVRALRSMFRGFNDTNGDLQIRWTQTPGAGGYHVDAPILQGAKFDWQGGTATPQGQIEVKGANGDTFNWEEDFV